MSNYLTDAAKNAANNAATDAINNNPAVSTGLNVAAGIQTSNPITITPAGMDLTTMSSDDILKDREEKNKQRINQVANTILAENKEAEDSKGKLNEFITSATDTVVGVESKLLEAEVQVATIGPVALADAADKTINTQGPKFMKTLQSIVDFFYKGKNLFKNAQANAEVENLKIEEKADAEQILVLMKTGLTEKEAKAKYDIIKTKREKEKNNELRIAEAAAALEIAKKTGGGRKILTLHQIQKGGRQSAKRTKKSINEFLNTSVTSSQILNMITNPGDHKRNTKVKRKRNNSKYSRRIRAKKMH